MKKIFITSDNHFFHYNIIKYCNRPFKTYQEMNEEMIKKWNSVVGVNDIVLHLGDFAFKGKAYLIRPRLNGTIILIRGNHDTNINKEDGFIIVEGNLTIGNLILSHRPLMKSEIPEGMINIFGHIHNQPAYSGICVCVEKTNYTPILLKELIQ